MKKFAKNLREAKKLYKEKTGYEYGSGSHAGVEIYDVNKFNRRVKRPLRKVNRYLVGAYYDYLEL